jgi:hypothetical protein
MNGALNCSHGPSKDLLKRILVVLSVQATISPLPVQDLLEIPPEHAVHGFIPRFGVPHPMCHNTFVPSGATAAVGLCEK